MCVKSKGLSNEAVDPVEPPADVQHAYTEISTHISSFLTTNSSSSAQFIMFFRISAPSRLSAPHTVIPVPLPSPSTLH